MNSVKLVLFGLLFAASAAHADELPLFQAVLHAGYRAGGSLETTNGVDADVADGGSFALAVELRLEQGDDRYYQLWYSRQGSEVSDGVASYDVDIQYLHIGGTLPFGGYKHAQPYLAAGLGATRFSSSAAGADDRTNFSGSIAFGLEVPLAKNAAIRFEGRGYLTAIDTSSAFFCATNNGDGVCRIVATGSTIFQAEALVGIAVRF